MTEQKPKLVLEFAEEEAVAFINSALNGRGKTGRYIDRQVLDRAIAKAVKALAVEQQVGGLFDGADALEKAS